MGIVSIGRFAILALFMKEVINDYELMKISFVLAV
jgi:hypothetical protein